jgi:hypothetical protein
MNITKKWTIRILANFQINHYIKELYDKIREIIKMEN